MAEMTMYMVLRAKLALHRFFTDERGAVNVVAIVVLIAITIVLALLLKDEIAKLIKDLMELITGKAKESLTDV